MAKDFISESERNLVGLFENIVGVLEYEGFTTSDILKLYKTFLEETYPGDVEVSVENEGITRTTMTITWK